MNKSDSSTVRVDLVRGSVGSDAPHDPDSFVPRHLACSNGDQPTTTAPCMGHGGGELNLKTASSASCRTPPPSGASSSAARRSAAAPRASLASSWASGSLAHRPLASASRCHAPGGGRAGATSTGGAAVCRNTTPVPMCSPYRRACAATSGPRFGRQDVRRHKEHRVASSSKGRTARRRRNVRVLLPCISCLVRRFDRTRWTHLELVKLVSLFFTPS
jgi:hypothetical protein